MNSKQLWIQDVKEFGNPIAELTNDEQKIFNFYFPNDYNVASCWYVQHDLLIRYRGSFFEGYSWLLTDNQVSAFHRDWNRMRNK